MHSFDFAGKTVFVVGGSSGIGNGVAQAFRAAGARVIVAGTRASAADYDGVAGSDLTGLEYASLDVSSAANIAAFEPDFGTLDVLVMSQGFVRYSRAEFEVEGWNQVIDINLNSLMPLSQKFRPMLERSRGAIVIVSSTSAFISARGNPSYAASKAGAVSLTRTLGEAWAPLGIRVNGIAPGYVETKLTAVTLENPRRREAAIATVPAGRFGTAEDMANAVMFLASPQSEYIVGHTLVVDGGVLLAR